jgi:hypothetical protein
MRKLVKSFVFLLVVQLSLFVFSTPAQAASPTFYLDPASASAAVGEEFTVDIMIDSDGEEVQEAVVVLVYDSSIIQIVEVSHSSIFEQYPDSGYLVDNSTGQLTLTGFSQDDYYTTSGDADIFGRITFEGKGNGTSSVEFDIDETYMTNPGSPPVELDLFSPTGGSYTLSGGTSTDSSDSNLPSAGLWDNIGVNLGIALIVLAVFVLIVDSILSPIVIWIRRRGQRTVVV